MERKTTTNKRFGICRGANICVPSPERQVAVRYAPAVDGTVEKSRVENIF